MSPNPADGRRPSPRAGAVVLLMASALLASAPGCGRPLVAADLPAMTFASPRSPIKADIEACIPAELRRRMWDVQGHGRRAALGERTALNFERLVKAAFDNVQTALVADCSGAHLRPWITARIDLVNREFDSMSEPEQITVITMTFEIFDEENQPLWQKTTVGEVIAEAAWPFNRRAATARDMGEALRKALDLGYEAIMESEELRRQLE